MVEEQFFKNLGGTQSIDVARKRGVQSSVK